MYQRFISDEVYFLQKLRDEAHRFAITFHQKKKREIDLSDRLTSINGIGNATVKRLISYFGSFDAIYKADIKELEIVLNNNLAKKIYNFVR